MGATLRNWPEIRRAQPERLGEQALYPNRERPTQRGAAGTLSANARYTRMWRALTGPRAGRAHRVRGDGPARAARRSAAPRSDRLAGCVLQSPGSRAAPATYAAERLEWKHAARRPARSCARGPRTAEPGGSLRSTRTPIVDVHDSSKKPNQRCSGTRCIRGSGQPDMWSWRVTSDPNGTGSGGAIGMDHLAVYQPCLPDTCTAGTRSMEHEMRRYEPSATTVTR